jgi:hypothetical protein
VTRTARLAACVAIASGNAALACAVGETGLALVSCAMGLLAALALPRTWC